MSTQKPKGKSQKVTSNEQSQQSGNEQPQNDQQIERKIILRRLEVIGSILAVIIVIAGVLRAWIENKEKHDKLDIVLIQPSPELSFSSSPTIIYTLSPTPSITLSPTTTPSPTNTFTPTITITPTPSEPIVPAGYVVYDNFDEELGLRWSSPPTPIPDTCKLENKDGLLTIECNGNGADSAEFTMQPIDPEARSIRGLAMAFRTLPIPIHTTQWGKYQVYLRFGSDCEGFDRMYNVSIRSDQLGIYEYKNGDHDNPINTPAPNAPNKIPIVPNQTQIIRIERTDDHLDFWLNDKNVVQLEPPSTSSTVCMQFQSRDNGMKTDKGYRGIELYWVATME